MRAPRTKLGVASALIAALGVAPACGELDVGVDRVDAGPAPNEAGTDSDNEDANQCLPPVNGWPGCSPSGCQACSELVKGYPLYFENHARCRVAEDCAGQHSTCSTDCPQPGPTDQCDGTPGQWDGCRGNGCWVCIDLVKSYPKYFDRHRNCIRNHECKGSYFQCSAACPAPTDADR